MASADDGLADLTDPIEEVLLDHPVRTAVLFGSRVRGTETIESDVDLAVEFDPGLSTNKRHQARLDLIVDLMEALETDDIDVSDLSTIEPMVGASAFQTGVVLVGDPDRVERLRDRFERRVSPRSHEERLQEFDDILARLEETV